jgi:hypothetical protein
MIVYITAFQNVFPERIINPTATAKGGTVMSEKRGFFGDNSEILFFILVFLLLFFNGYGYGDC